MADFWDTVTKWGGDVANWFGSNKKWIDPIVNLGTGALQQSQTDNSMSDFYGRLQADAQADYDNQKANRDAYIEWLGKSEAASNANRAAAAAAANKTELARQGALKKASKVQQKGYKKAMSMYQPYIDSGAALMPKITETYGKGLGGINSVMDKVVNADNISSATTAPKQIWEMSIPGLSEYFKKSQGGM